jgi:multimeric flavodoxin WrbA
MHILTLFGSPRRRGNTHAVLSQFEGLASAQHSVERITVAALDVRGCLGCRRCQKIFDRPGCPQKDDAQAVFERILAADLIIYASPLYAWDFTAQMKALFDRHFCLMKWDSQPFFSLMQGKRAALLVTCGDAVEDNADVIQTIFARQMACLQTSVAGNFILPHCTPTKARGTEGALLAREMAEHLLG